MGFSGPTAGAGGLDWVGGVAPERTGLRPAKTELRQGVKGAATDFVCWAESSHGPKREKEMKKGKSFFFLFPGNIFVKEII
jgi:hypothetical protein